MFVKGLIVTLSCGGGAVFGGCFIVTLKYGGGGVFGCCFNVTLRCGVVKC